MKHMTQTNRHSYCRTCLVELKWRLSDIEENYNIHKKSELAKSLQILTSQAVNQNDTYPKYLCRECHRKVQDFRAFRTLTLHSAQVLAEILESKSEQLTSDNFEGNTDWLNLRTNAESGEVVHEKSSLELVETIKEKNNCTIVEHVDNLQMLDEEIVSEEIPDAKMEHDESAENINDDTFTNFENCDIAGSESETESTEELPISVIKSKITRKIGVAIKSKQTSVRKKLKKSIIKFYCKLCPRYFVTEENLDAHTRTHQGLKPFQCTVCERSYNKSSNLRQHVRQTHAEQKEIACPFVGCDKVFRVSGSFRMHYRLKHTSSQPKLCTYICEDCGQTYKNITLLREHRYKHGPLENYPYKCEHCGKHFISQRYYKEHLLRHAGIKNFECSHCGIKKTTRNELLTHINNHTKQKQWPCPQCPNVYNIAASLKRHDLIVHKGIRPHACRFCTESFGNLNTLKYHEMRHTGEMPHECTICQKRFRQAISLKTHLKTHQERVADV